MADEVDGALGELSPFHQANAFYADFVGALAGAGLLDPETLRERARMLPESCRHRWWDRHRMGGVGGGPLTDTASIAPARCFD
ncbi:MAG: hypothetical protein L0H41_05305 [Microlunatus sp.]|nr:hypothetical protein [Microlunatus sp.]MDN5770585.1 hypothetical protein [Microlunatus sp.]MDN5803480.1 hypothetical protein [Microlunatus sp.]